MFTYVMADKNLGACGVEAALEKFCFLSDGTPCVDGMIRLAGMFNHGASSAVMQKMGIPVIKPICSYWNPEDGLLEEIQDAYLELEGFLEEDMGDQAGEFQGSSIEYTSRDQMEVFRKNAQKLHAAKGKR